MESVLVIGTDAENEASLASILFRFFNRLVRIDESCLYTRAFPWDDYDVVVVSIAPKTDIFPLMHERFPRAKLICLFDPPSEQTEFSARRAGAVFLGSFERFRALSKEILAAATRVVYAGNSTAFRKDEASR